MRENEPVSNRTRIIFALAGLFACLIGALCAELVFRPMRAAPLLRQYHAASLLFITSPLTTYTTVQPPPPPPPQDDNVELQRRLDENHAQSGDVQISLAWNNKNDLDLCCLGPDGEMVDGYNQTSRSGGILDLDMNSTDRSLMSAAAERKDLLRRGSLNGSLRRGFSSQPVENLIWSQNAPLGHYKVLVHQFCNKEHVAQTPFWLMVRVHGETHRISGVVGREDFAQDLIDPQLVYEFDVTPPKPAKTEIESASAAVPKKVTPQNMPPPRIVPRTAYRFGHFGFAARVAAVWGALAGLLAITLLFAQRWYLRLPIVRGASDLFVLVVGPVSGCLAALLAQLMLSVLSDWLPPGAYPGLCVLCWVLLGSLFGFALSLFTPNLPRIASPIAGALSAFAGSTLFLLLAAGGLDLAGRLLTACLIGGAIGALIALPEREPTLEPAPEPPPAAPRAAFEVQPPFVVRGTRTTKVGGLRQTDRRL